MKPSYEGKVLVYDPEDIRETSLSSESSARLLAPLLHQFLSDSGLNEMYSYIRKPNSLYVDKIVMQESAFSDGKDVTGPYVLKKLCTKSDRVKPSVHSFIDKKDSRCKICNTKFPNIVALHSHMLSHPEATKVLCQGCGKLFFSLTQLKSHVKSTHRSIAKDEPTLHSCDSCSSEFGDLEALQAHAKMFHTKGRRLKCSLCFKTFLRRDLLLNHLRMHQNVRLFKCPRCSLSFTTRTYLKNHMDTHNRVKAYKCNICGRAYSANHTLKVHKRKCCLVLTLPQESNAVENNSNAPLVSLPEGAIETSASAKLDTSHSGSSLIPTASSSIHLGPPSIPLGAPSIPLGAPSIPLGPPSIPSGAPAIPSEDPIILPGAMPILSGAPSTPCEPPSALSGLSLLQHSDPSSSAMSLFTSASHSLSSATPGLSKIPLSSETSSLPVIALPTGSQLADANEAKPHQQVNSVIVANGQFTQTVAIDNVADKDLPADTGLSTAVNVPVDVDLSQYIEVVPEGAANEDVGQFQAEFQCEYCNKICKSIGYLQRHLRACVMAARVDALRTRNETGRTIYKCSECSQEMEKRTDFVGHYREHFPSGSPADFHCSFCPAVFKSKANLKDHTFKHTGDSPYKCDICGKSFSQHAALTTHKLIHTGEKPHKCPVCGRGFANRANMKRHQAVHSDVKRFKCKICSSMFKTSDSLRQHQLVHSTLKPFPCTICQSGFKTKPALVNHMRLHESNKAIKHSNDGVRAAKRAKKEAPPPTDNLMTGQIGHEVRDESVQIVPSLYRCSACNLYFTSMDDINEHFLTAHSVQI